MVQLVCFFTPAILAVKLFEIKRQVPFTHRQFISLYVLLVGIINMVCCGVIAIIFQHAEYVISVDELFTAIFTLKYLLLGFAVAVILPAVYTLFQKYKANKKLFVVNKKQKLLLTLVVSFFFVFTLFIFTPYDIFWRNRSEFVFGFVDFWWIMASFGLVVFIIMTVVFLMLPAKLFASVVSLIFSITFCAYIQRMFMNFYITSMTGEQLNTKEHPIWALVNLIIWICIVAGVFVLVNLKGDIWKKLVLAASSGLILVQAVALISLVLTEDVLKPEERLTLTTDGLYEVASENNVIVFVLDHYDFSYVDAVLQETPDFYDKLEGFTQFDNMTSVYSRSYPSNTYLLTGLELDEYYIEPYEDCVDQAFSESTFLPYLKELGYDIDVYTLSSFVSSNCRELMDNYTMDVQVLYFETVREFLRCGLYFEAPYILKPVFWFYNELGTATVESKAYNNEDAILYQQLRENGLSIGNNQYSYKYIHTKGAHSPYTMNENCEAEDGVSPIQQWKGCVNMVCEYLDQMKRLGVYDSATIIITADHGHVIGEALETENTAVAPILFVKPAYAAAEPMKISHAPVSHTDIFPTIIQAAGGNYESYGSGRPIFSISEGEQRTRIFHYAEMQKWEEANIVDYAIAGDSKNFGNWERKSSKQILNSFYAVLGKG